MVGISNYQAVFTDRSTGGPTSYYWTFGDGSTSTSASPSHTYSSAGTYTVTEKVTNSAGSSTYAPNVIVTRNDASISTYSTCNDGQFTEQNMSIFASDNSIRLYMISYAAASNFNSQAILDMGTMANATGGFYAAAPDAKTLALIYTEIAGDLQTAAGVNTTMNMSFKNVNLTGVTVPGANVLSYVPKTQITWQNNTMTYQDQSDQWNDTSNPNYPSLSFNIGTINLSETWQTTFQLKVKQAGSIELFGPGSTIIFNNGADSMTLPPVFITSNPNLTGRLRVAAVNSALSPPGESVPG